MLSVHAIFAILLLFVSGTVQSSLYRSQLDIQRFQFPENLS